jgi:hypothetical protein
MSIMVSESDEVEVTEENDAWFYLDVHVDEMRSNDHGNEKDCIVRIDFIQTMKNLLLLDQRTMIIVVLLMVYTSILLTMKLFMTMQIEQAYRTKNAD